MTPSTPSPMESLTHTMQRLFTRRGESRLHSAWPGILIATGLALLITVLEHGLKVDTYSLTPTPFTVMGVAISFFLAFRNNTAYNRFWEARTLWGGLINTTRTLARQSLTHIAGPADRRLSEGEQQRVRDFQAGMVQGVVGYAHALRHALHDTAPFDDIAAWLSADELQWLRGQANVPIGILYLLGKRLAWAQRQGWVDTAGAIILEGSLTTLANLQGGCERIKNTPIPSTYGALSHRIVSFFCYALPFGMLDSTKYLTPVVVFLVSYAFFGLDSLGDEISNPFGHDPHDLPLEKYTETIQKNLTQVVSGRDLPDPAGAPPPVVHA